MNLKATLLHIATGFAVLQKVCDCSIFSATCLAILCIAVALREECYTLGEGGGDTLNLFYDFHFIGVTLHVAERITLCNRALNNSFVKVKLTAL